MAGDVRGIHAGQCDPADVLVLQRVLINLLDRSDQKRALDNVVNMLKPGGLLFAIEAFESGLAELNAARAECGLPPLPPAHHNLYLADGFFDHPLLARPSGNEGFEVAENLLSTHYFVTPGAPCRFLAGNGRRIQKKFALREVLLGRASGRRWRLFTPEIHRPPENYLIPLRLWSIS